MRGREGRGGEIAQEQNRYWKTDIASNILILERHGYKR